MAGRPKPGELGRGADAFSDRAVAAVFESYPSTIKPELMNLRRLILETAAATAGVGHLEETLKWGQPSYLTAQSKSGSTIRIDGIKTDPFGYAMFLNCKTSLVETFRELYPTKLSFGGNRSILFRAGEALPEPELRHCIALALTYHVGKPKRPPGR
jgi:hypothetical protein